jgi:hypothetical protein
MTAADDRMISHWWLRPGWRVGRAFYTWHVTFDEGSVVGSTLRGPTVTELLGPSGGGRVAGLVVLKDRRRGRR